MSRRSGIVNVRMVITEEKILSNIDKIQKMINPNSKKQIIQLEDDTYFKDLIDSIKAYLIEYPKKKNFPISVYKAAYGLVEYATTQFEENTKKVEELIRQREENIVLADRLRELVNLVETKDSEWKERVQEADKDFPEEIIETLKLVGKSKSKKTQNYQDAVKLLNARINNLETNLHIEIDMERTEDRSKALSFIGIEIAEALKPIPRPAEVIEEIVTQEVDNVGEEIIPEETVARPVKSELIEEIEEKTEEVVENIVTKNETEKKESKSQIVSAVENNNENELNEYKEATSFEKKPTLWEKLKNSKLVKAVSYVMKIRIRVKIELPNALPEGRGE